MPEGAAMKQAIILMSGAWMLWVGPASALTGNEWRAMGPDRRMGYVNGVVEAWNLMGAPPADMSKVEALGFTAVMQCVSQRRMTWGQINAIVDR
jgi:hypothetical protein